MVVPQFEVNVCSGLSCHMSDRREALSYIGAGAIGGMIGYYTGAQELLGIQSSEPSEGERTTDVTSTEDTSNQGAEADDSTDELLEFDWESGEQQGWEVTGRAYDGYKANFNIIDEGSISGSYSAQTEALNNRMGVNNPTFNQQLADSDISSISGSFRLRGDLDANDLNHNAIVIQETDGSVSGRLLFYHGGRQLRWNTGQNPAENDSPQVLRTFEEGETYNIRINSNEDTFSVQLNGEEYSDLPSADELAEISGFHIDSRNSTGVGPSIYDGPIYFTWDDISAEVSN